MDEKTKLAIFTELDRMASDSEADMSLGDAISTAVGRTVGRKKVILTAELLVVEDDDGNFPNLIVHTDDGAPVQVVSYDVREVH